LSILIISVPDSSNSGKSLHLLCIYVNNGYFDALSVWDLTFIYTIIPSGFQILDNSFCLFRDIIKTDKLVQVKSEIFTLSWLVWKFGFGAT